MPLIEFPETVSDQVGPRIILWYFASMSSGSDKIVGSDVVNEHVGKPIPETLWHYTWLARFQGIVTSKAIWATEYRLLRKREIN
jgi:hypothetical protein